jgi:hypothetical protein
MQFTSLFKVYLEKLKVACVRIHCIEHGKISCQVLDAQVVTKESGIVLRELTRNEVFATASAGTRARKENTLMLEKSIVGNVFRV